MCVSHENGKEIDLNVEMHLLEGIVGDMEDVRVGVKLQAVEDGIGGGHGVLDDDPFDLATIIEAVMNETKRKKYSFQEVEYVELVMCVEPKTNRPRKMSLWQRRPAFRGLPGPHEANMLELLGYRE